MEGWEAKERFYLDNFMIFFSSCLFALKWELIF